MEVGYLPFEHIRLSLSLLVFTLAAPMTRPSIRPRLRVRSGSAQSGRHLSPQWPKPYRGEAKQGESLPLNHCPPVWLFGCLAPLNIGESHCSASRCAARCPRVDSLQLCKRKVICFLQFCVSFRLFCLIFLLFYHFSFFSFRFSVFVVS